MMPAAKLFDPVLGIDIHIIQPPGPVPPVPIPHPFVGFLIDPFDFVPVVGATVLVNGIPRGQAGTAGKAVPAHIPIGGTFIKPPANECEMFMGSSSVCIDGDAFSYLALPALSCQCIGMPPLPRINPKKKSKVKSLVLPTSLVLPIPAGPPVLVGGAPTISLMALGMKVGMAALGKALKKLKKLKAYKRMMKKFKKARQKAFKKMKPGFLKCKVLKAEPVDSTTGEVVAEQHDFQLPWRLTLTWNRTYGSHSGRKGLCGFGWQTPADARLEIDDDGTVLFFDGGPGATFFESLPLKESVVDPMEGYMLSKDGGNLKVLSKEGFIYVFNLPARGETTCRIQRISDRCGNWIDFKWKINDLVEIQENSGQKLILTSTKNSLIESISLQHPESAQAIRLVKYEYDQSENLISVFDEAGVPLKFSYDGHLLIRHTDRIGLSFYYEYDKEFSPSKCKRSFGDVGLYDYHFEYFPEIGETHVTDSKGYTSIVRINQDGLPVQEVNPLGVVTEFEYDEVGRTIAVGDSAGGRIEYEYDIFGNVIKTTEVDGSAVQTKYNDENLPIEVIDPMGMSWKQEWDKRGLLVNLISPRGGKWTFDYNQAGDLVLAKTPNGGLERYSYDWAGNPVSVVDSLGNRTEFKYDFLGNNIESTDPEGCVTKYKYDLKSRLIEVLYAGGSQISCEYDNEDNLTKYNDELGSSTVFKYTGIGQLSERINPDGTKVKYDYDSEEDLIGISNEEGRKYEIRRDALGRISCTTDYWGNSLTFNYDDAGNISEIIDALNRKTKFKYDPLGRLLQRQVSDGRTDKFAFDKNGNIISEENENIKIIRKYDEDDNVIEELQGDFKIEYEYDLNGNRIKRTTSLGNEVRYIYDSEDDLGTVKVNGIEIAGIKRDRCGFIKREKLLNRIERSNEYDPDGQLTHQLLKGEKGIIVDRRYRYDKNGNLVERLDASKGFARFTYDPLGRIREFVNPEGKLEKYLYDRNGDIVKALTGIKNSDGSRKAVYGESEYSFDMAGNLINKKTPQGSLDFEWDSDNRLMAAKNSNGKITQFTYDPTERRLSKETDGRRTDFKWDEDVLLCEINLEGEYREYIFYPETFIPLAFIDKEKNVYFYQNDQIGLPHEVFNQVGEIVWSVSYGVFGKVEKYHANNSRNCIRFEGQYYDEELGLHYNRCRYYDPEIGAFISHDPIGIHAGDNLYEYAPNPWAWVDPYGLTKCKKTPTVVKNKKAGTAREKKMHKKLQKKHGPKASVQDEMFLRNKSGKIVKDPLTGKARRIDHVVIKNGKAVDVVETTSKTASKQKQIAKENRIRKAGGNNVKDRNTGKMVSVKNKKTRIERLP